MTNLRNRVSRRLSEKQTTSEDRRQYLQKMARLMCRDFNPTVQFTNISTAQCRHDSGDIAIDVGAEVTDQTVTDLPQKVWTLVAQEGLITHEIGHVLYTDFEAHESIKDDLGMKEMNAFHDIVFNPAEDAAIEEQLRWKFSCADEMDLYNANLFESQKHGAERLPIPQAVKIAILEKGCYDAGALEAHLNGDRELVAPAHRSLFDNKIVPEVNSLLADVMTEPDPETRYERMLEFWKWLKDILEDEAGQNATDEAKRGQDEGYSEVKPDDTSGMTEGQAADALEELDEDEVEEQLEEVAVPPEMVDEFEELEMDEDDEAEGDGDDDADEAEDADDGDSEQTLGDLFGDDEDASPSDDEQDAESGREPAESEPEQDEGDRDETDTDGDGGGGGGGEGQNGYPGHEGHTLVVKD